jgi:hypothetical protein
MLNDLVISIVRGRLLICGLGVRFARGPLLFTNNFTLSLLADVCRMRLGCGRMHAAQLCLPSSLSPRGVA